jgi:two-component system, OmpR family, sensor kinase
MSLSIRARLTLWYCSIVVVVLVTGGVVGAFVQLELAMSRLDEDLARTMATLEGVMRTEFGEGLSLEESAHEASIEVVVPDRTMALARSDGAILRVWGLPMERRDVPPLGKAGLKDTLALATGEARVFSRHVEHGEHAYIAAVIAPLASLRAQHAETTRATALGIVVGLAVAAAGGWFIGRQTLKPLTRMARQAREINERNPTTRLTAPPVNDELGDLATSFNELLGRLGAALNFQRQFMANASHELRTPASVVRTAAQVTLSQSDRTNAEYRESLAIIGEQATRLSRLVDAMFLLSRAEAHGVPLQPEFLNLDDLLAECVRAARVLAEPRRVSVVAGGDDEVGLTADDALLRQMVGNLLDNAIRHAESGGRVTAHLKQSGGCVTLRITNDGAGIPPDQQSRVFERFVRFGDSNGAGLGLPIARWIAEAHGGTLVLEHSEPGSTTFSATLPLDPTDGLSEHGGERIADMASDASPATLEPTFDRRRA